MVQFSEKRHAVVLPSVTSFVVSGDSGRDEYFGYHDAIMNMIFLIGFMTAIQFYPGKL